MKKITDKWAQDKNISTADYLLLRHLADNPGSALYELSKRFNLANSTTSKRLTKLKKLGYVEKVKGVFQISGGEL